MTRAAIYARVSSAEQRDRHTIESQLHEIRPYVVREGWELIGTFIDDGRSAKTGQLEKRDGFAELLAAAEAGRFDVLVVFDVDRLTRTGSIEERAQILGPFQRLGIKIATPSGGVLDMSTMLGELWVTMRALFASEENRVKAARIKSGKARAIAEGRKPAGPTPYGLAYDRATGAWSIDPVRGPIVAEIHARVATGESCLAICDDLHARAAPRPRGAWSREKVWKIARARYAVGEWTADKRKGLVIAVPPIVTEDAWQATQLALLKAGKRGLRKTKHFYLLEGLGVCAKCGAPMAIRSATTSGRGYRNPPAYVCRRRKLAHRADARCDAPIVRCERADAMAWAAILEVLADSELPAALAEDRRQRDTDVSLWETDVAGYERRAKRLERAQAEMLRQFRAGRIDGPVLDRELAAIKRETDAIAVQLGTARRAIAAATTTARRGDAEALVARLRTTAALGTARAKADVLREMVARGGAVFDAGEIRIEMTIRLAASRSLSRSAAGSRTSYETRLRIRTLAR